jgi:hypothetical protein
MTKKERTSQWKSQRRKTVKILRKMRYVRSMDSHQWFVSYITKPCQEYIPSTPILENDEEVASGSINPSGIISTDQGSSDQQQNSIDVIEGLTYEQWDKERNTVALLPKYAQMSQMWMDSMAVFWLKYSSITSRCMLLYACKYVCAVVWL